METTVMGFYSLRFRARGSSVKIWVLWVRRWDVGFWGVMPRYQAGLYLEYGQRVAKT